MDLTTDGNRAVLRGVKLGQRLLRVTPALEGMKRWLRDGAFSFEATPYNLELVRSAFPECAVPNGRGMPPEAAPELTESDSGVARYHPSYEPKTPLYGHQSRALTKMRRQWLRDGATTFALFAEMGTGKTKTAIDFACELFTAGEISAVLVVAPKGVHRQWCEEQIPTHCGVDYDFHTWNGIEFKRYLPKERRLFWFSINIDALKTERGFESCLSFLKGFVGKVLMIIDESQTIKSPSAKRTKAAIKLGKLCRHRLIMSGTPIAKNLVDKWSQFRFLNEAILGYRYQTSFKAEFCIMGGFQNREIVSHKNVEKFYAKTEPYVFRVTKEEELDLPPKVYDTFEFEMSDEQWRAYKELKKQFLTQLDNGEFATVANAAVAMMRLQQITCGYLPYDEEQEPHYFTKNPRLEALQNVLEQREGKTIVWARFRHDIRQIAKALGRAAITYYGDTNSADRSSAVRLFLDNPDVRFFVSNPSAGGMGLNLQGDCRTAIYYSNSFNSVERWQSEDRIHRIGTTGSVTYIDLICSRSVDRKILANLRAKKSLSDLVLDDIRRIVEDDT